MGTRVQEFQTFTDSILTLLVKDLQISSAEHTHGDAQEVAAFKALWFFLVAYRLIMFMAGVAVLTNLYRKAMIFEKGHCIQDPQKVALRNQMTEIQERIEEIYKKQFNTSQGNDQVQKSHNLIAWLLNRSKEAQSNERQLFFQRISQEMAEERQME